MSGKMNNTLVSVCLTFEIFQYYHGNNLYYSPHCYRKEFTDYLCICKLYPYEFEHKALGIE